VDLTTGCYRLAGVLGDLLRKQKVPDTWNVAAGPLPDTVQVCVCTQVGRLRFKGRRSGRRGAPETFRP